MDKSEEPWIQRESGVWISWRAERAQSRGVEQADDSMVERDWAEYWQEHGQPWRREAEVGIDRKHFLAQCLSGGEGAFKNVALTRADVEWLIGKQMEQRECTGWVNTSLPIAARVARAEGSPVVLLQVVTIPMNYGYGSDLDISYRYGGSLDLSYGMGVGL